MFVGFRLAFHKKKTDCPIGWLSLQLAYLVAVPVVELLLLSLFTLVAPEGLRQRCMLGLLVQAKLLAGGAALQARVALEGTLAKVNMLPAGMGERDGKPGKKMSIGCLVEKPTHPLTCPSSSIPAG